MNKITFTNNIAVTSERDDIAAIVFSPCPCDNNEHLMIIDFKDGSSNCYRYRLIEIKSNGRPGI